MTHFNSSLVQKIKTRRVIVKMWVSKKKWKQLESKVAGLEKEIQSQPDKITEKLVQLYIQYSQEKAEQMRKSNQIRRQN